MWQVTTPGAGMLYWSCPVGRGLLGDQATIYDPPDLSPCCGITAGALPCPHML